ncbi:hypothetical protein [Clostridium sp. KNHs205]|uniref:hypothetical protein n=1 Tax=Clostridium sp. KNHs205 TaxID=1449050 RepID=UPI00051C6BDF|nr:hypothetical protein [Clostridium sp. KNHs205]
MTENNRSYSNAEGVYDSDQRLLKLDFEEYDHTKIESEIIAFHETMHHWQFLFTPYGQLIFGVNDYYYVEIISCWLAATKQNNYAAVPFALMADTENLTTLEQIVKIFITTLAYKQIKLLEISDEEVFSQSHVNITSQDFHPIINLCGNDYIFTTLDIIEGMAKYQEAAFAFVNYSIPFSATINPNSLPPNYWAAYIYFTEQIGESRSFEFLIVCEIALSVDRLIPFTIFPTDDKEMETKWKSQHPAWRFIRIIDLLSKSQESIVKITPTNYEEQFLPYCKAITDLCGFINIEVSMQRASKYNIDRLNATNIKNKDYLPRLNDLVKAVKIKKENPWFLCFPLFATKDLWETVQDLGPYIYNIGDNLYFACRDNVNLEVETLSELHLQALAKQIIGIQSSYKVGLSSLQCGFAYYGVRGCNFFNNGYCKGCVQSESLFIPVICDGDITKVNQCSFGSFLHSINITDKMIKIDFTKKLDVKQLLLSSYQGNPFSDEDNSMIFSSYFYGR